MEKFLNSTYEAGSLSFYGAVSVVACALILGFVISLVYIFTHKREGYSAGFTVTVIMLTGIIAMIILLIGNNVAKAFSLAGAFSLVRFRSEPKNPKDIAYVFFALSIGLACGMGYLGYAVFFCVMISMVLILIYLTGFPKRSNAMSIKITIPENVDYVGLFDDIFETYTNSFRFKKVKTIDFGSLFQIEYALEMKRDASHKEFLDKIRCRNGNMNVSLSAVETEN